MPTMEQLQSYLGQLAPYHDWIVMIVNGFIAGWIASLLLGGGGIIRNALVGIIGSVVGGALVQQRLLELPPAITNTTSQIPYGNQILISTIGALIVIIVARFLGGR